MNVCGTYERPCGHPVKTDAKLAKSQSAMSQQQPMSQKSGVRSQRQAENQERRLRFDKIRPKDLIRVDSIRYKRRKSSNVLANERRTRHCILNTFC